MYYIYIFLFCVFANVVAFDTHKKIQIHSVRRRLLKNLSGTVAGTLFFPSDYAFAAKPMIDGEADNVGNRAARFVRPKPQKVLRPKLDQKFAVLLMRSSYNALDLIDCVAMVRRNGCVLLVRNIKSDEN